MLLRFTTAEMLNTTLVDVSTGERAYEIVTIVDSSAAETVEQPSELDDPSSSDPSVNERRHTTITDASGKILVSISWKGRRPDITILDEKVGQLTELFGSSTVKFMPKHLVVPTRFDTEYIWTATPNSLTLFDYDTETVKGTFHQNVIRVPVPFQSKSKCATPSLSTSSVSQPTSSLSNLLFPTCSSTSLASSSPTTSQVCGHSSSTSIPSTTDTTISKSSFISTHLPGVGSNYLEFCQHPLVHDVEIILSFLMMEILRRGRFLLTPYTFEKPKLWQLKEARDIVMRRLRRNTV